MKYNILTVDDSKAVLFYFKKTIKISGIPINQVYPAENGAAALKILEVTPIDLVITDLNMPEMNGLELIKKMKASEALVDIPIIVITTEGRGEYVKKVQNYQVDAYLTKPFHPEDLKQKIIEILGVKDNERKNQNPEGYDF